MTPIDQADMRNMDDDDGLAPASPSGPTGRGDPSRQRAVSCSRQERPNLQLQKHLFFLSCELNLSYRCRRFRQPTVSSYWLNVKFTSICVTTSTGSPFSSVGWYTHCFTASMADGTSSGWPLITGRFWIVPSLPMMAFSRTTP